MRGPRKVDCHNPFPNDQSIITELKTFYSGELYWVLQNTRSGTPGYFLDRLESFYTDFGISEKSNLSTRENLLRN